MATGTAKPKEAVPVEAQPVKQVVSNVTAQRMADALNVANFGSGLAGMAIIDIVSATMAASAKVDYGLEKDNVSVEGRDLFRRTLGQCMRIAADQLDPPVGKEAVDPLTQFTQHVSSNVTCSAYDPDKRVLRVTFNSGATYDYVNVPPEVRDLMLQAESVGSFIAKSIKPVYTFTKL